MNHPDSAASYITAVVTLYLDMPDTPMRISASDQWLARHLHQDGVPLETVETALLLGSLRRMIRPPTPRAWRPSAPWPISAPSSRNSRRIPPRKTTAITSASSYEWPLRNRRQMFRKIRFQMIANSCFDRLVGILVLKARTTDAEGQWRLNVRPGRSAW